jgi:hypothetical protein
MPPFPKRNFDLPLSNAHRDACLRAMHLQKSDKHQLHDVFTWLNNIDPNNPVDDDPDSLQKQLLLGSFLLVALFQCQVDDSTVTKNSKIRRLLTDLLRVRRQLIVPTTAAIPAAMTATPQSPAQQKNQVHQQQLLLRNHQQQPSVLFAVEILLELFDKRERDKSFRRHMPAWMMDGTDFLASCLEGMLKTTTILVLAWSDYGTVWDSAGASVSDRDFWHAHLQEALPNTSHEITNDEDHEEGKEEDEDISIRLQRIGWKMACYRSHLLQLDNVTTSEEKEGSEDDNNDAQDLNNERKMPTRRQRLLTSTGVIMLFNSLYDLATQNGGNEHRDKRQRTSQSNKNKNLGSVQQEGFSRWTIDVSYASLDNAIGPALSMEEIQQEMLAIVRALIALVSTKPAAPATMMPNEGSFDDDWLKKLYKEFSANDVDPLKVIYYLQDCADLMYSSTLEAIKVKPFDAHALPYLDEASFVNMDSLDPLLLNSEAFQGDAAADEAPPASPEKLNKARRAVTPPVLTEAMELNEWSVSLLCLDVVKPSKKLVDLLIAAGDQGADTYATVMYPILNRALLRLSQEHLAEKETRKSPVLVDEEIGQVEISGDATPEKNLCKAVIALYYHALEAILFCESERLSTKSHPRLVFSKTFHRSLLACCVSCVVRAISQTQKLRPAQYLQVLPIFSVLLIAEINAYEFLKVSETFLRALTSDTARGQIGSPLIFELPRLIVKDLRKIESGVIDTLLWSKTDDKLTQTLPDIIDDMIDKSDSVSLWPPECLFPATYEAPEDWDDSDDDEASAPLRPNFPTPDHPSYAEYRCVSYLIRRVLRMAHARIQALCNFLDVPPHFPLAKQVWVAFRYLLRNHVYLVFERHIDHWILCCLYGVSKTLKYDAAMTFTKIIDAYVVIRGQELGDITCQRIVRHIKLDRKDDDSFGDVIALYNSIFVPKMKTHLLKSKSIHLATQELLKARSPQADTDGGAFITLQSPSAQLRLMQERLTGRRMDKSVSQTVIELGRARTQNVTQASEIASGHKDETHDNEANAMTENVSMEVVVTQNEDADANATSQNSVVEESIVQASAPEPMEEESSDAKATLQTPVAPTADVQASAPEPMEEESSDSKSELLDTVVQKADVETSVPEPMEEG